MEKYRMFKQYEKKNTIEHDLWLLPKTTCLHLMRFACGR